MPYSHKVQAVPLNAPCLLTPLIVTGVKHTNIQDAVSHAKRSAKESSQPIAVEVTELKTKRRIASYTSDGNGLVKTEQFILTGARIRDK
jgi:hypothetical protein